MDCLKSTVILPLIKEMDALIYGQRRSKKL